MKFPQFSPKSQETSTSRPLLLLPLRPRLVNLPPPPPKPLFVKKEWNVKNYIVDMECQLFIMMEFCTLLVVPIQNQVNPPSLSSHLPPSFGRSSFSPEQPSILRKKVVTKKTDQTLKKSYLWFLWGNRHDFRSSGFQFFTPPLGFPQNPSSSPHFVFPQWRSWYLSTVESSRRVRVVRKSFFSFGVVQILTQFSEIGDYCENMIRYSIKEKKFLSFLSMSPALWPRGNFHSLVQLPKVRTTHQLHLPSPWCCDLCGFQEFFYLASNTPALPFWFCRSKKRPSSRVSFTISPLPCASAACLFPTFCFFQICIFSLFFVFLVFPVQILIFLVFLGRWWRWKSISVWWKIEWL